MTLEQLKRATKIGDDMQFCKRQIRSTTMYTQDENVNAVDSILRFDGFVGEIVIPKEIFRVVGKLILAEYQQRLARLEEELDKM